VTKLDKNLVLENEKPVISGIEYSYLDTDHFYGRKFSFRRLLDIYFKPKSFEKFGRLYEAFGIRYFKEFAMVTIGSLYSLFGLKKHTTNYHIGQNENRNLEGLANFEYMTRFNEALHGSLTIMCGNELVQNISSGNTLMVVGHGICTLGNLYCVMLQRYNRARIYNTMESFGFSEQDK